MPFNAAQTLLDKWPILTKYGATQVCLYREIGTVSYDGSTVTKPVLSSTSLDILFDSTGGGMQRFQQIATEDDPILSIDRVAVFPALSLSVAPKKGDVIVDASAKEWDVKAVADDPVGAHYELWVRPL